MAFHLDTRYRRHHSTLRTQVPEWEVGQRNLAAPPAQTGAAAGLGPVAETSSTAEGAADRSPLEG